MPLINIGHRSPKSDALRACKFWWAGKTTPDFLLLDFGAAKAAKILNSCIAPQSNPCSFCRSDRGRARCLTHFPPSTHANPNFFVYNASISITKGDNHGICQ